MDPEKGDLKKKKMILSQVGNMIINAFETDPVSLHRKRLVRYRAHVSRRAGPVGDAEAQS